TEPGPVTGIDFNGDHSFFSSLGGNPNFSERTADGVTVLRRFYATPQHEGFEDTAWDTRRRRIWACDLFGYLTRINPETERVEARYNLFSPTRCVGVAYDTTRDLVYVSTFFSTLVVKVDPDSGQVLGELFRTFAFDTGGLAYDPTSDTLWVGRSFGAGLVNVNLAGTPLRSGATDNRH